MKTTPLLLLLALGLLLGGCASYDNEAPRGHGLTGLQHFFVLSNANDNHALDQRIVAALQARGFTADSGPMTMMPDNTQAIISYQDHWEWDFGEHLYYLKLSARNPDSDDILAAATFSSRVPLNEPLPETVGKLVAQLFAHTGSPQKPAAPSPDENPKDGAKRRNH